MRKNLRLKRRQAAAWPREKSDHRFPRLIGGTVGGRGGKINRKVEEGTARVVIMVKRKEKKRRSNKEGKKGHMVGGLNTERVTRGNCSTSGKVNDGKQGVEKREGTEKELTVRNMRRLRQTWQ